MIAARKASYARSARSAGRASSEVVDRGMGRLYTGFGSSLGPEVDEICLTHERNVSGLYTRYK